MNKIPVILLITFMLFSLFHRALGGSVEWECKIRTVIIRPGGNFVQLQIGNANALVNGTNKLIDPTNPKVAPEIVDGRAILPLIFVAEYLGCDVSGMMLQRQLP